MKSTDHNINNPLKTLDIEMLRSVESYQLPNIIPITKEGYDLIQIHDPHTIYYIIDSPEHIMYYGDMIISNNRVINKYFIGIGDRGEYVIYFNERHTIADTDCLIPICRYEDPQIAINELNRFNKVGSHIKIDFDIYNIIKSYIEKDISTHDLLIGIITIYGYNNDPHLQNVIEHAITYNATKCQFEFPEFFADQLPRFRDQYPISVLAIYSNLYDLIVKYNFFRDKKYHTNLNELNLAKEIKDIFETMYTHILHRYSISNVG